MDRVGTIHAHAFGQPLAVHMNGIGLFLHIIELQNAPIFFSSLCNSFATVTVSYDRRAIFIICQLQTCKHTRHSRAPTNHTCVKKCK